MSEHGTHQHGRNCRCPKLPRTRPAKVKPAEYEPPRPAEYEQPGDDSDPDPAT